MDNTNTIATVFLLIIVQMAQGKPSDPQICIQVTVCGHDGQIYPTPCDAPSFPPPCYDYKRITKGSCICKDRRKDLTPVRKGRSLADNPCSHGAPFTNSSGSPLVCGGGLVPIYTKFDSCPKDYSCNFKFAAFDGPALCCPKEPVCKTCESIAEGQRCGQDGGPYRLNCTQCCQSPSSKCAEWSCDAGGWLCKKPCSRGNGGGLEKCPRGNPLAGVFCGRGPHRQNCPKGYFCNTDPTDRFAVCCPDEGAISCGPEECGEVCTRGQKCVNNSCYCFRAPCNCPTGPCTHKCVDDTQVLFPQ